MFAIFVGGVKVYQSVVDERDGRGRALLPTLADFTYKRRVFEVLCDVAIIVISYYGAFLLRFDGVLVTPYYQFFMSSLPHRAALGSRPSTSRQVRSATSTPNAPRSTGSTWTSAAR